MIHGTYVEVKPVITKYLERGVHIYYFCGGRGIGKTYGALDLCREIGEGTFKFDSRTEGTEKFLYLRRTGVEAQVVSTPESSPFKSYNRNEGYDITTDYNSKLGFGKYYLNDKDHVIGYSAGLSTFANLRGIDYSDVSFILYDECIPENKNKHPLKDEGYLLLNMLETVNRNRILEGRMEVVLCMLSNPIDLGSPLLSQLDITGILNSMIFKNRTKYTDINRSLHIEKYVDHIISKQKADGMLYKFASTTGFNERALSGDFLDNDLSLVKKVSLSEYTAFLSIENICVYQHKSDGTYYISQVMQSARYVFKAFERDKFKTVFYWKYKLLVIDRAVFYDNYSTKVVFEAMIKYKPIT